MKGTSTLNDSISSIPHWKEHSDRSRSEKQRAEYIGCAEVHVLFQAICPVTITYWPFVHILLRMCDATMTRHIMNANSAKLLLFPLSTCNTLSSDHYFCLCHLFFVHVHTFVNSAIRK